MSLTALVNRFPPNICRFVARKEHGTKPKSHTDIAKESGLSRSFVATLSKRKTWNGIPIDVVDKFSSACGVDLASPNRTIEFLRHAKKNHLRGADAAQRRFIASLLMPKSTSAGDQPQSAAVKD